MYGMFLKEMRKKLFQPLELKRISRTDQFRSLLITIVCIFLFIYVITWYYRVILDSLDLLLNWYCSMSSLCILRKTINVKNVIYLSKLSGVVRRHLKIRIRFYFVIIVSVISNIWIVVGSKHNYKIKGFKKYYFKI
jgi:hypothetical protein